MSKIDNIKNLFRSKKAKEEITKQLKDISSDFEDIVWYQLHKDLGAVIVIIASSLVFLMILLVAMNPHISNDKLLESGFILFMINVVAAIILYLGGKE